MVEVEPTFWIATRIFWAILWRSLLMSVPTIFIVGMITAAIFSSLGNDGANNAARIGTFFVAIPIQISCIQLVIGKTFGRVKLLLATVQSDPSA